MGDIIQSLKEFIWDIIGYLIPGFVLIIIFNFVINPNVGVNNNFLFKWEIFSSYLIIVIAYVLGFVVYSVTLFKIKSQDFIILKFESIFSSWINYFEFTKNFFNKYVKSKYSKNWQENFKESSTVKSAKEFLKSKSYSDVDNMRLNEIRNILMSRNPLMDEKVYTFMFRSSVFDHISTMLILVWTFFIIQSGLNKMGYNIEVLKTEKEYVIIYFIFFFIIPLLGNCKRMFFSISQRIPFSNLK